MFLSPGTRLHKHWPWDGRRLDGSRQQTDFFLNVPPPFPSLFSYKEGRPLTEAIGIGRKMMREGGDIEQPGEKNVPEFLMGFALQLSFI